jgi:hypothetical protein
MVRILHDHSQVVADLNHGTEYSILLSLPSLTPDSNQQCFFAQLMKTLHSAELF